MRPKAIVPNGIGSMAFGGGRGGPGSPTKKRTSDDLGDDVFGDSGRLWRDAYSVAERWNGECVDVVGEYEIAVMDEGTGASYV